jgi:hypothetical protein
MKGERKEPQRGGVNLACYSSALRLNIFGACIPRALPWLNYGRIFGAFPELFSAHLFLEVYNWRKIQRHEVRV